MDGIIEFLVIAAVIIVGIVSQNKKSKAEQSTQERPPIPHRPNVGEALPEPKAYDPYEEIFIPTTPKKKKKKRTPTPFLSEEPIEEGTPAVTSMRDLGSSVSTETEENAESSEYALNSVDEARKAIVWGEILQRKY
jgi:hypothetical protein